ncbi:hypothetical protein HanRHA438_Chr17g0827611 [Helianthus annuus]|nr:hypothetical protein HanRHA438_Chr17g0827611 [Helianthus annuus]
MAIRNRNTHLIPILIIIFFLAIQTYGAVTPKKKVNEKQIQECSDMVSRSQCSRNIDCRWCQSDVLDDTCFSKSESLRLPSHIFVC